MYMYGHTHHVMSTEFKWWPRLLARNMVNSGQNLPINNFHRVLHVSYHASSIIWSRSRYKSGLYYPDYYPDEMTLAHWHINFRAILRLFMVILGAQMLCGIMMCVLLVWYMLLAKGSHSISLIKCPKKIGI